MTLSGRFIGLAADFGSSLGKCFAFCDCRSERRGSRISEGNRVNLTNGSGASKEKGLMRGGNEMPGDGVTTLTVEGLLVGYAG